MHLPKSDQLYLNRLRIRHHSGRNSRNHSIKSGQDTAIVPNPLAVLAAETEGRRNAIYGAIISA